MLEKARLSLQICSLLQKPEHRVPHPMRVTPPPGPQGVTQEQASPRAKHVETG